MKATPLDFKELKGVTVYEGDHLPSLEVLIHKHLDAHYKTNPPVILEDALLADPTRLGSLLSKTIVLGAHSYHTASLTSMMKMQKVIIYVLMRQRRLNLDVLIACPHADWLDRRIRRQTSNAIKFKPTIDGIAMIRRDYTVGMLYYHHILHKWGRK